MKQAAALILALTAGTASIQALAQSAVTIYGTVDAALVVERGGVASPSIALRSGAASASRIGFRGTEDLGGGLSAYFNLETGSKIDTGELDAANTIFNRQAFVGLRGGFGEVALGRQYTPMHVLLVAFDPFSTGYAGTTKNLFPDNGSNVRTSNTISWKSPRVQGFDGELAYSVGEQSQSSSIGRQYGGALGYVNGPLALRASYNSRNSDVAATATTTTISRTLGRNYLFGATWQLPTSSRLPAIKLHAIYGVDKGFNSAPLFNPSAYSGPRPTASTDSRDLLLGASTQVGPGTVMFSAQYKNDRTSVDQDAVDVGIGYLYNVSKRTGLYASYAHVNNMRGAGYTVNDNTEAGTGNTGVHLGIRHSF